MGIAAEIAPSPYTTRSNGKRASCDDTADPALPAATGVHAVVNPAAPAAAATGTSDLSAMLAQDGPMRRGCGEE